LEKIAASLQVKGEGNYFILKYYKILDRGNNLSGTG
jgi:hypothetical protein